MNEYKKAASSALMFVVVSCASKILVQHGRICLNESAVPLGADVVAILPAAAGPAVMATAPYWELHHVDKKKKKNRQTCGHAS